MKEIIMYKSAFSLFCQTSVVITLLFVMGNVYAYTPKDQSSLVVNLGPDWKISSTQEQSKIAKITEYTNITNSKQEALTQTTLQKSGVMAIQNGFATKLYQSTKDLMGKDKCSYEDIKNIPQTSGKDNEWGIFWQCAKNSLTGFMFFIDGDPTTMYTFTYQAAQNYPLTPTKREDMIKILKAIQLCYKNKPCVALVS
jgi:hypothetical protein